jgi:NAD-dependent deacetylase
MTDDATIELQRLIEQADKITVFTGAGISTESGIPDFRSPVGVWTKAQPIEFQDFLGSEEMRRESWRRKRLLDETIDKATPNRGHQAIAALVKADKCISVITQNIDDLHFQSGIPAEKIIELHGNGTYASCLDCGKRFELAAIFEAFAKDETLPVCDSCGGIIKTATISFGQSMPEVPMIEARTAALRCDLFIVIGSSLVVYPAAALPLLAREKGAALVILNREATDLDEFADLVLHQEIGDTLTQACAGYL